MNPLEIEDRVRAATRAAADTVTPDSVSPLRLPSDRPFRARPGSFGSVWGRRLAPMAAAAAVVAVAVAMVTVGRTVDNRTGGPTAAPFAQPVPVRTGPPISSYVASGRVPRYYVSIESHGNPNFNPSYAVVRATATGAAIDTYTPAAGGTVVAVTADAHDRTFVLDEQPWAKPDTNASQNVEPRTFFSLVLNQLGQITMVRKVSASVPGGQLMTGFALSPDGTTLAIAVQPDNNKREPDLTEVSVITLATGAMRTWTANGTIGFGPDDARSLSWTNDGRTLAFDWLGSGSGLNAGVWLLDVETGGGSLLADSREAVSLVSQAQTGAAALSTVSPPLYGSANPGSLASTAVTDSPSASAGSASPSASAGSASPSASAGSASPSASAGSVSPSASAGSASLSTSPISVSPIATAPTCQEDSIITPDGSTIVCGAITATKASGGSTLGSGPLAALLQRGAETEFIEYSVASGKVARILGYWKFGNVGALAVEVLWSNASGSVLIGVIPDSGGGRVGVISGNEFTPLPVSGAASTPMLSGTW
jgi:WD40-like Beta Propeller Repeat